MKKKATDSYIFFDKADERKCDEKDCNEIGEFFAPKSPNSSEKYLFCSKHIKLYNKRWNFFAGKSQNEIYEFQKNDIFEGKPTKPFSTGSASKINFEFNIIFDTQKLKFRKKRKRFENKENYSFNEQIENSLTILKLKPNFSEDQLKARYKKLVKKYHPDVKNTINNKEQKMKEINKAYKILKSYREADVIRK